MQDNELVLEEVKEVYVVFVDDVTIWWLRFLKKGFRHCYLLVELDDGMTWLEVNPMSNRLFLNVYKFVNEVEYTRVVENFFDVKVIKAEAKNVGLELAPIALFTCVETVKRVLGIHDRMVITPYQLYKKLKIVGKKS